MRAVNLIPDEQRGRAARGSGRSQGGAYAVLALLAGLAILALLYGAARHQVSSRSAQTASLLNQAQSAQARAGQLAPYASFLALREQRMQAVSQLVDSRFDWAHALHELGRVLPAGASISTISGAIGSPSSPNGTAAPAAASAAKSGGSVTSATPPGSVPIFTVNGCATSQAEVALALERLRLIDGVSEVTLQSSTKAGGSGGAASGGGSGTCAASDPAFTVQVSFAPLPAASAVSRPASTPGAVSGSGAQPTSPAGGAR